MRDFSYGPLGGYSFYCKKHVVLADLQDVINSAERSIIYYRSVADNALAEYKAAGEKSIEEHGRKLTAKLELEKMKSNL